MENNTEIKALPPEEEAIIVKDYFGNLLKAGDAVIHSSTKDTCFQRTEIVSADSPTNVYILKSHTQRGECVYRKQRFKPENLIKVPE